MNFKNFLSKIPDFNALNEASERAGRSEKMERAKSDATTNRARDAARKRVERAHATPRDKKPKQELMKEVLLVKTKSGRLQLIFKDSFNSSYHEKVGNKELTLGEAEQVTKDPNFEQTRASKLLFGEVKKKEESSKEKKKESSEKKEREEARPKQAEERRKAKRVSQQEMFQSMSQMGPDQLMGMPADIRTEYFRMLRKPPPNTDFDRVSYEGLTVQYGLSNISSAPYNQQVLNAIMFLAKLKVGASEQEIQTFMAMAPESREFTKSAFYTAKKILSQIGDQCLQNMMMNVETTGKPVNSEGMPDMECGNYKFKISAGGEISMSSTQFDQSNKNFKKFVATALTQALSSPELISSNKALTASFEKMQQGKESFSPTLVRDDLLPQIMQNPKLVKQLQSMEITGPDGQVIGTVLDQDGNLNQLASLDYYTKAWQDGAKEIVKGGGKNALKTAAINNVLKIVLRGDGIVDPMMAPNHLITVNGILPMTDDYFNTISTQSTMDINPSKDVMTSSNITNYRPSAAEMLKKFTTVVEAQQAPDPLKDALVNRDDIEPINIMVDYIVRNNDFMINASLLPGFSSKDLNSVQYNYVTIGKKTIKIPVMKGENITNEVLGEASIFLNDVLVEALTNNFVLASLVRNSIVTETEAEIVLSGANVLNEDSEYFAINLKSIFENAVSRMYHSPYVLLGLIDDLVIEEYKRDYKQEYRNYHGKEKQRKERSARTVARELLKKKGLVKKGDGKDVDHKKPLRDGGSKGLNNLRVRDKSENRSDNGHHKGEKQDKDWK